MILQIVSGGQTGADQGGLEAALALGIPVGGWAPKGWLTENGPDPTLESKYGMKEHAEPAKLMEQFNHLRTTQMGFFREFIKGRFRVLNIAGNRESVQSGIQQAVKSFLIEAIPLANK